MAIDKARCFNLIWIRFDSLDEQRLREYDSDPGVAPGGSPGEVGDDAVDGLRGGVVGWRVGVARTSQLSRQGFRLIGD